MRAGLCGTVAAAWLTAVVGCATPPTPQPRTPPPQSAVLVRSTGHVAHVPRRSWRPGAGGWGGARDRVWFASERSAELTPQITHLLDRIAALLQRWPAISLRILVLSPTDPALSWQRADAIADYLVAQGVSRDRLQPRGQKEYVAYPHRYRVALLAE